MTCLLEPHVQSISTQTDLTSSTIEQLESDLLLLQVEVQHLTQNGALKKPLVDSLMARSDQMTNCFTTLQSVDLLKTVFNFVEKSVSIHESKAMTKMEQFVAVLMKLN